METPPKEDLVRASRLGFAFRDSNGSPPLMVGHFAVFNEWTEISSFHEGNFMERVAPGAFFRSFQERTPKVLFNHGSDPQIGDKVLGPVTELREDERGAYYEVELLDTSYNHDLEPGLRAGAYGASFRFSVEAEEFVRAPDPSDYNPKGLSERTITEANVPEFGPVTFPAYAGASAGMRSLTDEFIICRFGESPKRLRQLIEHVLDIRESRERSENPAGAGTDSPSPLKRVNRKRNYLKEKVWKL